MINEKEIFEVWDVARHDFFDPPLPPPVLASAVSGITILPRKDWASFIDMKKYEVYFNPGCLSHFSNPKNGGRNIFQHEIDHYVYCPYDERMASLLVMSALKAIENYKKKPMFNTSNVAAMCSNLHNDYVDDFDRIDRGFRDLVISQTRETVDNIRNRKGVSNVWKVFVRGYERLWDVDLHLNLKDEELEEYASEIELLLKKDWDKKEKWPRQVYRITEIFLPLIEEEVRRKGKECSSELTEQMYGDPTVVKYKDKGKGGGDLGEVIKETGEEDDPKKTLEKFKKIVKILRGAGSGQGAGPALKDRKDVIFHTDLIKLWYTEREKIDFKIISFKEKFVSPVVQLSPETWNPRDPLTKLDFLQTKQTSPRIIPGRTTKKWSYEEIPPPIEKKEIFPNYMAALDTSGSMSGPKFYTAAYTAFLTSHYVVLHGSKVAPLNFSDRGIYFEKSPWSTDMDHIMQFWATEQAGGTELPGDIMLKLNKLSEKPVLNAIITDTHIHNFFKTYGYIKEIMQNPGTQLVLFKIGSEEDNAVVSALKELNCEVYTITSLKDLNGIVLGRVRRSYEYALNSA